MLPKASVLGSGMRSYAVKNTTRTKSMQHFHSGLECDSRQRKHSRRIYRF